MMFIVQFDIMCSLRMSIVQQWNILSVHLIMSSSSSSSSSSSMSSSSSSSSSM